MSSSILYHNDQWLSDDSALFTARDRLRLGDGVFDTLLCVNGKAVFAADHYTRLMYHLNVLGIMLSLSQVEHSTIIQQLIQKNDADHGRYALNFIISRGISLRGIMPSDTAAPSLTATISPVPSPQEFPDITAIIASSVRKNEGSPLSQIKSCNYGDHIIALREASIQGANEAIMLNNQGNASCASAGNIYAYIDGALYTPPLSDGAMDGTVRKALLDKKIVHEQSLSEEDIKNSDAIYISNSIKGFPQIYRLNGHIYDQITPPILSQISHDSELAIVLGLDYN